MPRDCFGVCTDFFSRCAKMQEAKELLSDIGNRVAQFVVEGEEPFYVNLSKDSVVTSAKGSAAKQDLLIETTPATCEEMLKSLGASFTKLRKEAKLWTKPCLPWEVAWFGMLVRIGQGR